MVWRFKPRFLHRFPSFGWVENLLTSFFKASPKAKIKTHLSRRSAEVPARLCKTGRAIPEIMKPFTTPFLAHSQDWQLWKCTFPRGESQETCKWPDDSFKRIFLWRSLGTSRYFYCGRFSEGGRDRAGQQYLIEPGHCTKPYFTCKCRRCTGELWEKVLPCSLIDSHNYFHQPN